MPYRCCVPQCSSVSNKEKVMLHKFPKDQTMLEKWLTAIGSNINKINRHTKICSKHFEEECYIVTSMGQWRILKKTAIPSLNIPKGKFETPSKKRSNRCETYQEIRLATTNLTDIKDHEADVEMMDLTLEPEIQLSYDDNLVDVPNDDHDFVENQKIQVSQSVQAIITLNQNQLISHQFLTEDQLKHFTGCSRKLFTFIVEVFGNSYKVHSTLSVENELLIMFMKYRLNLSYSTLANFFAVETRTISNIFIKWTKHLYTCLKQINFWNMSSTSEDQNKVILDCTEFFIERSSDPVIQQATYSSYYGTNTFKILVACTEKGEILYVSDVYGGSISDRKITAESGILKCIEERQFVLADRGFDISDLLKGIPSKPPFKKGNQLSEEDIMKTRAVANRRIIVENIIGLAKKHKILKDRIPSKLFRYSNEIIYNCFMICNFKNSIVDA